MRTLIIEDEQPAARRLAKLLNEVEPSVEVVAMLDSIQAAAAWFRANASSETLPELAFVDIHLSDGLSFEIFQRVHVPCPVVFTTAYDEYSLRAFKVNSVDYLLKPIKAEELQHSVEKFKQIRALYAAPRQGTMPPPPNAHLESLVKNLLRQETTYRSRFLVQRREQFITIAVEDVAYFYSEHKLTHLVMHTGAIHIVEQTLEELETQMNPRAFFRANRQCIVSLQAIDTIHTFFNGKLKLALKPPPHSLDEVVVSREKASMLKQWLDQ
jgi:two-component system LytT family response regulator